MPAVIEDFVPLPGRGTALVTMGKSYTALGTIAEVNMRCSPDGVVELEKQPVRVLAGGRHLRLGRMFHGHLVYSSQGDGIMGCPNAPASVTALQPHPFEFGVLYTDWEPGNPFPFLWLNGRPWLRPWPGYEVVGNAWYDGGWVYCEARQPKPCPASWELWRIRFDNPEERQRLMAHGANPSVVAGRLYYDIWNERTKRFEFRWRAP
jgi:hypothetical protein